MFMGHGEGQFKNVDKHQANILLNQPLYLSNSYLPLQTSASNLLSILVNQCLFVCLAMLQGMWDFSLPTRSGNCAPAVAVQGLTRGLPGKPQFQELCVCVHTTQQRISQSPNQGSKPSPSHWKSRALTTEQPGKPLQLIFHPHFVPHPSIFFPIPS